eukprot:TRINITY_DN16954_c0_g1_i1.p1 TRINITY_DN16954_c0_g1~~TRINITY_DN16954_c0_g1_i1.p1  ORF type:complete len:508 (+),score=227.98 TRINITY_DN16954_c0_g1_i1:62-1525(+)
MADNLTDFMMSRPLLPEAEKSHLQTVLATIIGAVEKLQGKMDKTEKAVARLSGVAEEQQQGIGVLQGSMKQLEMTLGELKHEHPLRWEVDEIRSKQEKHSQQIIEVNASLSTVKGVSEANARARDEMKAGITHQLDGLQREIDNRNRAVNEAMSELANRVDTKLDTTELDLMLEQIDETQKRQTVELVDLRRSALAAEDLAKRLTNDVEQMKIAQLGRDRAHSEQLSHLETTIETSVKKHTQTSIQDVHDIRAMVQGQQRRVDDLTHNLTDKVEKKCELLEHELAAEIDKKVAEVGTQLSSDRRRLQDSFTRVQHDVAIISDDLEKVEGELRSMLARLRDDTDHKLLELLNAVQGVEHAKTTLERQMMEAGRIMCQGLLPTSYPTPHGMDANRESPLPPLDVKLARSRSTEHLGRASSAQNPDVKVEANVGEHGDDFDVAIRLRQPLSNHEPNTANNSHIHLTTNTRTYKATTTTTSNAVSCDDDIF